MISENNEDAYSIMIDKYKPLIIKYADYYIRRFNVQGIEKEELVQEGIIGLCNAINSFNEQDKCIFYTFANLIIRREMERYIKKNMRFKHLLLSNAASFSESIGIEDLIIEDTIYNEKDMVEVLANDNYYEKVLYDFKYELNDIQSQIYELRLNRFSNKEISILLDISYKTVDNNIRLLKNKFKLYIQSHI